MFEIKTLHQAAVAGGMIRKGDPYDLPGTPWAAMRDKINDYFNESRKDPRNDFTKYFVTPPNILRIAPDINFEGFPFVTDSTSFKKYNKQRLWDKGINPDLETVSAIEKWPKEKIEYFEKLYGLQKCWLDEKQTIPSPQRRFIDNHNAIVLNLLFRLPEAEVNTAAINALHAYFRRNFLARMPESKETETPYIGAAMALGATFSLDKVVNGKVVPGEFSSLLRAITLKYRDTMVDVANKYENKNLSYNDQKNLYISQYTKVLDKQPEIQELHKINDYCRALVCMNLAYTQGEYPAENYFGAKYHDEAIVGAYKYPYSLVNMPQRDKDDLDRFFSYRIPRVNNDEYYKNAEKPTTNTFVAEKEKISFEDSRAVINLFRDNNPESLLNTLKTN